jgi:SAM-dependent methyltransferase
MTTKTVDATKAEEFAGHLIGVLNSGCLALQCSIGHQVGLFDTMAGLPASTSEKIAEAAGLAERYVREWLGALTTGRIVEYDPSDGTYVLPAEHAASLTRAAGPENFARILQFVPLLATVEAQVVDAFRNGGGVPYSEYETFHALMAEDSGAVFDASLIDTTLPLVAGLPGRLETGIDVADIGCGSGHAVNLMARAYPRSRFTGYDFSADAIEVARAEAAAFGLDNARFEAQDVAWLEVEDGLDLVTAFDAVHDQAQPTAVLARVSRALRPGGTFLMVDIKASSNLHENHDLPWAPFLYTASTMHCMAVSLELEGEGLGTVWGRQKARGMLDDAGFEKVEIHEIETDPFNLYYVATAG